MAVPPTRMAKLPRVGDRNALRRRFRTARAEFVNGLRSDEPIAAPDNRLALEIALAERVIFYLSNQKSYFMPETVVGAYHASEYEISPDALVQALRARGHVIGFPWFADRGAPMLFRSGPDRAVGPYGVDQPSAHAPGVAPDILLMPLVAADLEGNRLGQGGGHYDRTLAALRQSRRVLAIGLAWDVQIADALPAEPWDEPLNLIATPSRLIEIDL